LRFSRGEGGTQERYPGEKMDQPEEKILFRFAGKKKLAHPRRKKKKNRVEEAGFVSLGSRGVGLCPNLGAPGCLRRGGKGGSEEKQKNKNFLFGPR